MKIVITGGFGFIGKNLAAYLRAQHPDYELHCVDWFEDATEADKALYQSHTCACFASSEALPIYDGANVVIHLAAMTTVQESIKDPAACFENNVTKTQELLDNIRLAAPHAHFVFASTGGAIIGEYDGPINEEIPARPLSPYGASKLAVEGLLTAYNGSYGLKSASLRFSNVYGPGSERKKSVIAKFCQAYLNGGELRINGDGLQTRDYVYVDDICKAIDLSIMNNATGVFQLGTGIGTTINDLIEIIFSTGHQNNPSASYVAGLPGEVRHNVCEIAHARQTLGYNPSVSLQEGIMQTLCWYQNKAA